MRFLSVHAFSLLLCAMMVPLCSGQESPSENTAGNRFSYSYPGAVPAVPVPMDLMVASEANLTEIHVTLGVRQHEILVLYTCVIDWAGKENKKGIPIAIPFKYRQPQETSSTMAPMHRLPFAKAIDNIQVGANGMKMDYKLEEGAHPQHDAPSLQSLTDANCWLVGQMKLKPGKNIITYNFTIPYLQTISGNSGRQAQTTISAPVFELFLANMGAWSNTLEQADIQIFPEEVVHQSISIQPSEPALQPVTTEKGVITVNLLGADGHGTLPRTFAFRTGFSMQFSRNVEDLPEGIERLRSVTIGGKRMTLTSNYSITASSTLPQASNGETNTPENLKTGRGFWAENSSGHGQGETLNITLDTPGKLNGLVIQSGASPIILGRNDSEAIRYPDVAYSLHSRPRTVSVSLNNGEYEFKATLRDDWNPQLISVPYFNKSVKTVKITLNDSYQGSASDDNYITTLLPVVE